MSPPTSTGKELPEEDNLWAEGSFIESCSPEDWELKKRTFHMKHNEEMDYNCKQCNVKISVHNKDWHDGRCDKCFNKKHHPEGRLQNLQKVVTCNRKV